MKKLFGLLALSALMLVGCGGNKTSSGGGNNSSSIEEGDITVNFYLDYNQLAVDEIYASYKVFNNTKLTAPATPTSDMAPLPEFPVFKGWSTKQIIDDESELWDFDKDVLNLQSGVTSFRLFGFWASEGE